MKPHDHPPVKKGEVHRIEIVDLTHDGEGVGRIDGFTVFVPEAVSGDVVSAKEISVKKTYARALIENILISSCRRITPPCPKAEWCGGCQLAHMHYHHQLAWKEKMVREALARLGKVNTNVKPIIGMKNPEGCRNKAQFPVRMAGGKLVTGFYQKRTHKIVDTDHCRIQHPLINKALRSAKRVLADLGIEPYNAAAHSGVARHIVIRASFSTKEPMLVIVTRTEGMPKRDQLTARLREELPELASVYQNINPDVTNVIFGPDFQLLGGKPYIVDRIGELKFAISPRSFFQVNLVQTEVL